MNPKPLLVLKNLTVPTDMIFSSDKKAKSSRRMDATG
jgi:hypothetical protein